jgi:predicted amidohydrolase
VAVRAWVNIGSYGLVHLRETADLADIDVDATLAAIARHRDVVCGVVCGVKLRSSTDVHIRNIGGPVHDLATTMTKLLTCGMPLDDVIETVAAAPRRILRTSDPWLEADGTVRHATVFRVTGEAPPHRTYRDATGAGSTPGSHIVPVATVVAGQVRTCEDRRP